MCAPDRYEFQLQCLGDDDIEQPSASGPAAEGGSTLANLLSMSADECVSRLEEHTPPVRGRGRGRGRGLGRGRGSRIGPSSWDTDLSDAMARHPLGMPVEVVCMHSRVRVQCVQPRLQLAARRVSTRGRAAAATARQRGGTEQTIAEPIGERRSAGNAAGRSV